MDHIEKHDWTSTLPDRCFVYEQDIDNSVTERILRNRFRDPTLSDSEEEGPRPAFDWDQIFKRTAQERQFKSFIPGLRAVPPYPKLSALNPLQHSQLLKVVCSKYPNVLEKEFVPRPTKQDYIMFEELKEIYEKEQQEYKEWAKIVWTNSHCSRSLRPKPTIETVYEAEFKVRANKMKPFPKTYKLAAQIPLEILNNTCEMICQNDLKKVTNTDLLQSNYPVHLEKKITILRPSPVPKPCIKHPSRFILPHEQSLTMLPITEVHRELSQWALDSGARFVACENALKCLVEVDRCWMLPVSVCEAFSPDGDKSNVVVLDSEFATNREPAMVRTYKAYRHLLEYALVPPIERVRLDLKRQEQESIKQKKEMEEASKEQTKNKADKISKNGRNNLSNECRMSVSSDEEDNLFIDIVANDPEIKTQSSDTETTDIQPDNINETNPSESEKSTTVNENIAEDIGFYNCTCKDTEFEVPPQRSYKKWLIRNKSTKEEHAIIIHCSHKTRGQTGEIIMEPIPEYQLELGGSELPPAKQASLAMSLALRKNASLLNVRVCSSTGDIVTIDNIFPEEFSRMYGTSLALPANRIHSTLNQLEGLVPGHYILQHDSAHGTNALLYAPAPPERAELTLDFNSDILLEADEAKSIKTPPILGPVLLPSHKFRKVLPLAFTPHDHQLAKEPKRPVTRQKTPPRAIRWPKKKQKKKKN